MKESKDMYQQELSKLREFEAFKSNLYDKSIGGDFDRPPDSFIELHVGKQKTDNQLKYEAFAKSSDFLLQKDDQEYYRNYHMTKSQLEKTDQEKKQDHINKALDRYQDRDDQQEQGRDEQTRDENER